MSNLFIVVDVEADGPCPGKYSMVSLGAVVVKDNLTDTFYGEFAPVSEDWIPEALAVSGKSRKEHEDMQGAPVDTIRFLQWIDAMKKKYNAYSVTMWSDNPAFDWQWVNYYIYTFGGVERSPLGYSARRIGDFYSGIMGSVSGKTNKEWKRKYRKTKHTHHPVDDAKGNAEALLSMLNMIK